MKCRLRVFILTAITSGCLLSQPAPQASVPGTDARGLGSQKICAFIAIKDTKRALAFYRDSLGLRLVRTEPIALVFDANGTMLRIQIVPNVSVAPYTVLGWNVSDIASTARKLQKAGVAFMSVTGIKQDKLGIWTAPNGDRIAWFKDPEGHILSIAQLCCEQ